jgi:hypothetical protein
VEKEALRWLRQAAADFFETKRPSNLYGSGTEVVQGAKDKGKNRLDGAGFCIGAHGGKLR